MVKCGANTKSENGNTSKY